MYWSKQMNEFLKNAMINLYLDYKAVAVKFISFNEGLHITITQIIKYIKLLKNLLYKQKNC